MKRGGTKEEIIHATQELIARNGIRAVRVDEIAQTLGISKRTLYEMFTDKNDLVGACLDAMSHQQQERIVACRKRRGGNPLQKVLRLAIDRKPGGLQPACKSPADLLRGFFTPGNSIATGHRKGVSARYLPDTEKAANDSQPFSMTGRLLNRSCRHRRFPDTTPCAPFRWTRPMS